MAVVLSGIFACSPEAGDVYLRDSKSQTDDSEDSIINQKLNELKDRMVSPPVILSHKSGETVYGSGDRELIFIKGYADRGNTIDVYVNGALDQSNIIVDSSGNFETINGIEIVEGKNVIKLVSVKPSGIKSSPTEFTLFLDVPEKVEYSIYKDDENPEEIKDIYYTQEDYPLIYIKGAHLPLSSIYIQVNDRIIGEIKSDNNGIFEMEDVVLNPGSNEIAVWAKAADGYISTPVFTNVTVYNDLDVPNPSELTGYSQESANYLSWARSTNTDFDSYKLVRVEDPCINPEYPADDVIATFSDISADSYVDSNIMSGRSYYYTLWTVDKAGRAISSNVLAIPRPVYSISIEKVPPFSDISVNRREWFYQYYEITNMGNVTVDLQPMMAWIKLNPNPDDEMEISPLWEVHLWNPSNGQYYFHTGNNNEIYETYIAPWAGGTVTEKAITYETDSDDNVVKVVTESKIKREVGPTTVNLKRVMTETTETTVKRYNNSTGKLIESIEEDTAVSVETVEPDKDEFDLIENIKPGEKIKIAVKIQNISAANNEEITVHFHFAPVDCNEHFFIDEIVSTGDIYCKSSGRN